MVEKEVVGKYTIKIMQDEDGLNPRTDYDNFGRMICFHRNYNLGDKHSFSVEEAQELTTSEDVAICLDLYLYDHSGITMSVSKFSCPWDTSNVGFIYVTKEDIKREYKEVTPETIEKATKLLVSEVENYDDYLTGNCWGYVISSDEDDHLDSCWGFLGDSDYCLEEARSVVRGLIKDDEKELEKLKENEFDNHFVLA